MPIHIHTYTLSFGVDAHTNACACGMTNLTSLAPGRSLIEFPRSDAPRAPTFSFQLSAVLSCLLAPQGLMVFSPSARPWAEGEFYPYLPAPGQMVFCPSAHPWTPKDSKRLQKTPKDPKSPQRTLKDTQRTPTDPKGPRRTPKDPKGPQRTPSQPAQLVEEQSSGNTKRTLSRRSDWETR